MTDTPLLSLLVILCLASTRSTSSQNEQDIRKLQTEVEQRKAMRVQIGVKAVEALGPQIINASREVVERRPAPEAPEEPSETGTDHE